MNRLVLSILELSRYESGQMPLNRSDFDVSQMTDDMLRRIFANKNINAENCLTKGLLINADPMQTEQDACIGFLRAQTKLIQPKIIVCLGRIAAMRLIRPDFKISCEHGQFTEKGGILFTALYHPSALLRDETKRPDTFSDLKTLQSKVREVCTRTL